MTIKEREIELLHLLETEDALIAQAEQIKQQIAVANARKSQAMIILAYLREEEAKAKEAEAAKKEAEAQAKEQAAI
jgi:hypothetical protein